MHIDRPAAHYDVVIIGGGLVGCSLALMLHGRLPSDARILIVEASPHGRPDGGPLQLAPDFDVRTTALSEGSRLLYRECGLWPELAAEATPIETVHVSDRGHFGAVTLDSSEAGVGALGHVVENRRLGTVLLQAVERCAGIDLLAPAETSSLVPTADGMRLHATVAEAAGTDAGDPAHGHTINARLVVLAEGGRSPLTGQLGISVQRTDYAQQALIANIGFEQPHANRAFERFTDSGPLAVLPLQPHEGRQRGALIWTLPAGQADELCNAPEQDFLAALQRRFGYRLGRLNRCGQRHCFPLQLMLAREQVRPALVLLGNVAHTLHPVAGQGLNLALRDARALTARLEQAISNGESPGSMAVLKDYLASRQSDQARTIAFSHHLGDLFAGKSLLKSWTRKFGLFSIDLLPPVKRPFTQAAMGLAPR